MGVAAVDKRYRRSPAGSAVLALFTLIGALAMATPANALDWTNVLCTPGIECNQKGTPDFACQCGLWADSPSSISETAFLFVESRSIEKDETGKWMARIDPPVTSGFDQLRTRASANDSSILKVIAYNAVGAGLESCAEEGPDVGGVLQWGPADDNSYYYNKTAPLTLPVVGLCIILTDDADTAAPVSGRTSAQIDMIQLRNSATKKMMALEQFKRDQ